LDDLKSLLCMDWWYDFQRIVKDHWMVAPLQAIWIEKLEELRISPLLAFDIPTNLQDNFLFE
jgi:hypothetical protein